MELNVKLTPKNVGIAILIMAVLFLGLTMWKQIRTNAQSVNALANSVNQLTGFLRYNIDQGKVLPLPTPDQAAAQANVQKMPMPKAPTKAKNITPNKDAAEAEGKVEEKK